MKVLIISTNRNIFPFPVMPIGACIVAEAAERSGHEVKLLDLMFTKDHIRAVSEAIDEFRPDIVGLSVRNIDNNDIQNPRFFIPEIVPLIALIGKKTEAMVVIGGSAVSVMPAEILRYTGVPCAVLGDGETVFPELLRRISGGGALHDTPGTAWMEDGEYRSNPSRAHEGSDSCISPDFSRWLSAKKYVSRLCTVPVQTKLGCHFKCVYCTYRKIEGTRYRFFDRGGVVEAVRRLVCAGLSDIEFVDNVFNAPYEHAVTLCEDLAVSRHGGRLQSLELNPLFVDDNLIALMEKAGFTGIGITVESASGKVLEGLGKGYSSDSVYKAAEVVGRRRLPCIWIFMLGGPGETEDTVLETLRFAEKAVRRGDAAFFNLGIRIYPGTDLEATARRQGLLSLPSEEMLSPVFYVSQEVDFDWMVKRLKGSMNTNLNFINSDSIGVSYLPLIHRMGRRLGVRPPLWRFTRPIRKGLRLMGIDA